MDTGTIIGIIVTVSYFIGMGAFTWAQHQEQSKQSGR